MKASAVWVSTILAAGAVVALAETPAAAIGFGVGIGVGGRIPGTGIYTGVGYRSGRYGRGVGVDIFVDGSYHERRKREPRREPRGEREDRSSRREERETVPRPNVSLEVAPGNVWVYLNGVLTRAYGEDRVELPPGRHRLEFVARGYRTEAVEVEIRRPGGDYHIERRLERLGAGAAEDPRLERAERPVSIEAALRQTETLWAPRPESSGADRGVTPSAAGNPSDTGPADSRGQQ